MDTEARKLNVMSEEDRKQYKLLKLVVDFRAQAAEREKQRVRIRRAHHELWQLELREKDPVAAQRHMAAWLSLCDGRAQRLAALQQLHEALAVYEPLVREDLSIRHARLEGSLGELQDMHVDVLKELLESFDDEPHYLYV